ncbi:MAG: hypothetical protein J7598_21285 [Mitsuaria chitosanitabida]|uniref:hypothetical protein n=1 Tax=Roseateles chitosanitabidus TaxID=65048 RepID=UPI001B1BE58C|nr:hypothetical protein [Roseateles chitosanitabidus]MBO9689145.1 hypothetical protein [Roseateles chitosanitabidus]
MITRAMADEAIARYLRALECAMDLDGSALPWNKDRPPHQLVVVDVQAHDFGWVHALQILAVEHAVLEAVQHLVVRQQLVKMRARDVLVGRREECVGGGGRGGRHLGSGG